MVRKLFPLFAALILIWAVGCSNNSTDTQTTDQVDMNDEFAGLTTASEAPGFGDTELAAAGAEEVEVVDPIASTAAVLDMTDDPSSGYFRFRAVWGHLRLDTSETEATSFDGSLEISRGAVLIRRTIRFELAQDYIVPRVERTLLEWVSTTTIHNDGIVADLIVPELRDTYDTTITIVVDSLGDTTAVITVDTIPADNTPVEVTFNAGAYSRTFTLGELAALDTVVTLDDSNEIAIQAFQRTRCGKGSLTGRWGVDETGQGVFSGIWIDHAGLMAGWVMGYYGLNDNGDRVFAGKWINMAGTFEGFIAGTWTPQPNIHASDIARLRAGGSFEGHIYNANHVEIGDLAGKYKGSENARGGFFQARWRHRCTPTLGDDDELFDDGM
jgi:hypothetical protein